ncbi:MAG: ABC transporter permease [Methyloprofundus sp.]|nr:ABC transporter permease [Methyloprofundus sp.]
MRIKKFLFDIYDKRELLLELAQRDFQKKYMGSYLGFFWVYLQPLLFISVLYFVFSFGFKAGGSTNGVPFVVFLLTGMTSWFYIAENFSAMTNVISNHSFLLKKVDFRLSLLPMVKLMSSFIPHVFFILITFIIAYINNIYPTLYALQLVYYYFSMVVLLIGLGWLTSSTQIFVPDVSKIVSLLVTFGFWLTPIFWKIDKVPQEYQWIVMLNPAAYIVQGYRDSIISHTWFWERPYEALYFWGVTLIILLAGITIFKRLRPHFAEVV